jgi:hypothetical protein
MEKTGKVFIICCLKDKHQVKRSISFPLDICPEIKSIDFAIGKARFNVL